MSISVPVPGPCSTTSGKRPRADPLLGRGSARDDAALPINCIKPTAVFIKAQVGEHERKCLVDTGATVSLVSREFISGPLKPCYLKAQGIGGENLQILGMKELPWKFESPWNFQCIPSVSGCWHEEHLHFGG